MTNILAIGAHPDDIELGCGGTISKHISLGDNVFVLIMTNGERGSHTLSKEECMSSLKKLGVEETKILFGNFPDGFITNNLDVISFIEDYLKLLQIEKVYTHFYLDRHQDHANLSKAVSSASRKIPELLLFQGPSTNNLFEPHYYIEISSEELNKKIDALSKYQTQRDKGIVDLEWVKSIAIINGLRCNTKYAEAFALNHLIKRGKNV